MLSFIAWCLIWLLTLSLCLIVLGGIYYAVWRRFDIREGWSVWLEGLVWIAALVANLFVHQYFDLFSIFW